MNKNIVWQMLHPHLWPLIVLCYVYLLKICDELCLVNFFIESQFYRLLPVGSAYKVTKVEYVVQPSLIRRFRKAREKLKDNRGTEASFPVLGFHGTKEKNIESICKTGFMVPGEQGFEHATDPGNVKSVVSSFASYESVCTCIYKESLSGTDTIKLYIYSRVPLSQTRTGNENLFDIAGV